MTGQSNTQYPIPSTFHFPLSAFLFAFLVYALTLAPDLTWQHNGADGGDLIAASFTGGIAHPPGYPLYLMLGRLFALLPVGNVPYRYNLFSAVTAALAAALTAWTVRRLCKADGWGARVAGAGAGLSLAFAPLVWGQAVITEVYALNGLFSALLVALSANTPRRAMHVFALAATLSLAIGHHLTLAFFLPLVVFRLVQAVRVLGWQAIGASLPGLLIGLALLAYLPLAARGAVVWGDPSTPAGLWWLVSGALYRGYAFGLPIEQIIPRVAVVARTLTESFTLAGVAIGLIGAAVVFRQDAPFAVGVLLAGLGSVIFAAAYLTSDSQVYLIPLLVCFAGWIGAGWGRLVATWSRMPGRRPNINVRAENARPLEQAVQAAEGDLYQPDALAPGGVKMQLITACALFLLLAFTLARNWQTLDVHADRAAREFVDGVLQQAPQDAIIITGEDRHTFALWVGVFVERPRTDIIVVDQDMLRFEWYRAALRRNFPAALVPESSDVAELIAHNAGRPVCRPTGQPPPLLWCEKGEGSK